MIRQRPKIPPRLLACALVAMATAHAGHPIRPGQPGPYTGTLQSGKIYTPPDPQATGGIRGTIDRSVGQPLGVLAMPQDRWQVLYLAELGDAGAFEFTGLPPGRYDLIVLLDDRIFEGLTLTRLKDNLTPEDHYQIKAKIDVSSGFYNEKHIDRCEGVTGRAGQARAFLQELRTRPITLQSHKVRSDLQIRSIKLVLLEQVGPGWVIEQTRELIRQEVGPPDTKGFLPSYRQEDLNGIRVVTSIKNIGTLRLRSMR